MRQRRARAGFQVSKTHQSYTNGFGLGWFRSQSLEMCQKRPLLDPARKLLGRQEFQLLCNKGDFLRIPYYGKSPLSHRVGNMLYFFQKVYANLRL